MANGKAGPFVLSYMDDLQFDLKRFDDIALHEHYYFACAWACVAMEIHGPYTVRSEHVFEMALNSTNL